MTDDELIAAIQKAFADIQDAIEKLSGLLSMAFSRIRVAETPMPISPVIFTWPTDHKQVTQPYLAHPDWPAYASLIPPGHEGIDIRSGLGGKVYTICAGVVTFAGEKPGRDGKPHPYGQQMRITHRLPNGVVLESVYAHLKPGSLRYKEGVRVNPGAWIAIADATGNVQPPGAAGTHLHLTLYENGKRVDPMRYLQKVLDQ